MLFSVDGQQAPTQRTGHRDSALVRDRRITGDRNNESLGKILCIAEPGLVSCGLRRPCFTFAVVSAGSEHIEIEHRYEFPDVTSEGRMFLGCQSRRIHAPHSDVGVDVVP